MQDDRSGLGSGSGYARDKHCAANRKMERVAKETGKEPPLEKDAETGDKIHQWLAEFPKFTAAEILTEDELED